MIFGLASCDCLNNCAILSSISDTFSPYQWHPGDSNGSASLSYNSQHGFKPYGTPNLQSQILEGKNILVIIKD